MSENYWTAERLKEYILRASNANDPGRLLEKSAFPPEILLNRIWQEHLGEIRRGTSTDGSARVSLIGAGIRNRLLLSKPLPVDDSDDMDLDEAYLISTRPDKDGNRIEHPVGQIFSRPKEFTGKWDEDRNTPTDENLLNLVPLSETDTTTLIANVGPTITSVAFRTKETPVVGLYERRELNDRYKAIPSQEERIRRITAEQHLVFYQALPGRELRKVPQF